MRFANFSFALLDGDPVFVHSQWPSTSCVPSHIVRNRHPERAPDTGCTTTGLVEEFKGCTERKKTLKQSMPLVSSCIFWSFADS